ncbi:MAG: glucose-1-phosphate cytidylyltransferase [Candidatus Marinimicrobia bacterium]|jgi:glucose-1-phosphate cytidylyltransferase|nr:glucose-1-phosphate cytidylyltransferase [Candidatus Neomarinimicrobiota bacterium]
MKVIILAGGWGTRMGQLAELLPKPMVSIGNMPVLWHIMKIYSHYGYNDFIIALGVKGHVIKEYFYNFEALNSDFTVELSSGKTTYHSRHKEAEWKVTLVDTGMNTLKGGRIKRVEPFLYDDINMITYGDGVADIDIKKLVNFHKSHGKTVTFTGVHPSGRFGEFEEVDNQVISFQEKPDSGKAYINGGFMVFNRNLLDILTADEDCDFEFAALEKLAKEGEVMVYKHEGLWECMDHERDVAHLNKLWNENKAFWKIWE